MIDFVSVGKKISECRKSKNMTQDDLALQLFVSRQLISKWELGTGIPSIDTLLELSILFEISIEELLCLNQSIVVDEADIFKGHDHLFILNGILNGTIQVSLNQVFDQLSPIERMMILRGAKENRIRLNSDLISLLTSSEKKYLMTEDNKYDIAKTRK